MDLGTTYMGLELKNPFVPSSSPLTKRLDPARQLEDAGASALVMYSLFEEDIEADELQAMQLAHEQDLGHGEASSYLPMAEVYPGRRDEYLEQLRRLKEALEIPVIASLNGTTLGGWVRHAKAIQEAGADGLELKAQERIVGIGRQSILPCPLAEGGDQVAALEQVAAGHGVLADERVHLQRGERLGRGQGGTDDGGQRRAVRLKVEWGAWVSGHAGILADGQNTIRARPRTPAGGTGSCAAYFYD